MGVVLPPRVGVHPPRCHLPLWWRGRRRPHRCAWCGATRCLTPSLAPLPAVLPAPAQGCVSARALQSSPTPHHNPSQLAPSRCCCHWHSQRSWLLPSTADCRPSGRLQGRRWWLQAGTPGGTRHRGGCPSQPGRVHRLTTRPDCALSPRLQLMGAAETGCSQQASLQPPACPQLPAARSHRRCHSRRTHQTAAPPDRVADWQCHLDRAD
mmetsp:Transcript_11529/g.34606  ORF Transcript_11529/g.34606 Transcript_11529/m.34606 type:complete len:209 (-) Transcript_11529:1161-1787(-)